MGTGIRDISGDELRLFGESLPAWSASAPNSTRVPSSSTDVMRLLRGDFGASYIWDARKSGGSTRRSISTWRRAIFAATKIGISSAIR